MYLTISKRFEFCCSRVLSRRDRNAGQNRTAYGRDADAAHGVGGNFVANLIFHGKVDPKTGMMISISTIKNRVSDIINEKFDHRSLGPNTPPFDNLPASIEIISRTILEETVPLFADEVAKPVACYLEESPFDACTAYSDGRIERHFTINFSAARRTYSPLLSYEENEELFGIAARQNGHGHNYRLRATLHGDIHQTFGTIISHDQVSASLDSLRSHLDHKHLNRDIKEFQKQPMTTELLARYIFLKLSKDLPLERVRLYELDEFSVEYDKSGNCTAALTSDFRSTHRLASKHLSESENAALYGRCNYEHSHGHRYLAEASACGEIDEESGTIFNYTDCKAGLNQALGAYNLRHLDLETEDFIDQPSTGENIVAALWPRINLAFGKKLTRLRLWETANNRFTLRKDSPMKER